MTDVIKVAVLGAAGRMGTTVCAAVEAAPGLDLVARVDAGEDLPGALALASPDVVVDFTVPAVTEANVHAALDAGAHVVVGTTGWTPERLARVEERLADLPGRGVLIAPNFGLSAVLAMSFAAKAARYFESAEVIELHHPDKVDAPSGTARHTAAAIAAARADAGLGAMPDATEHGLEAHEEILLGNPGEQLVIRQDSFDRSSFMPGVLLAIREVAGRPGLTVGLEHVLDLG